MNRPNAGSPLRSLGMILSIVALQACIPLFVGGLFQTLRLSFEFDSAYAEGEKRDFQILVFPEDVKVAKKWLQISGRLTPAAGEDLPGQLKIEAKFEDLETGKSGQRIALTLRVDDEGFFKASKKIRKNIAGGQMMSVTLEPTGTAIGKGSRATICVDLVQKKGDLGDLPACVSGGSSNQQDATLSSIQSDIFTPTCAVSGCHSTASSSGGLVLAAGRSFGNLVNVPATGVASFDRVEPGDPERSYLVKKLRGDPDIVGARMPRGGSPLAEDQIDRVARWIENGAADD